jgi:hypothetical protein
VQEGRQLLAYQDQLLAMSRRLDLFLNKTNTAGRLHMGCVVLCCVVSCYAQVFVPSMSLAVGSRIRQGA